MKGSSRLFVRSAYNYSFCFAVTINRNNFAILQLFLALNISNGLVLSSQYTFGPLPLTFCLMAKIFKDVCGLTMMSTITIIMTLRILYASLWKSFGSLNEDFFFKFFSNLLGLNACLHSICLRLLNSYQQPDFFICCGVKYEPNKPFIGFLSIYLRGLVTYCGIAFLYVKRKQKMLTSLQETTRDSMGLPRAPGPHPSYNRLLSSGVLVLMFFGVVIMHEALHKIMESGSILAPPHLFLLPMLQGGPPLLMSLGLPSIIMLGSGQLSKGYKKNLKGCVNILWGFLMHRNSRVHSILS